MFIVLEMQTTGNSTAVLPVITRETLNEAESVYHQILAAAAISQVDRHTALVIGDAGEVYDQKCYWHIEEQVPPEGQDEPAEPTE